jgi:FXSXX-COOH protein
MFTRMPRSPTPDPALAAAIRRMREERGMTREALAFRSGLTTGSVARVELAQSVPSWDTVRLLAAALGVTLVQLAAEVEGDS